MTESKYCDDFDYFRTKTSYLDEKVSLFSPEGVERGLEHDLLGAHNSAFTDAQSNIVDMLERDDDIDDILSAISDDFRSVTNDMNVEYSMDNLFVDAQYSPYHTSANQVMLFPNNNYFLSQSKCFVESIMKLVPTDVSLLHYDHDDNTPVTNIGAFVMHVVSACVEKIEGFSKTHKNVYLIGHSIGNYFIYRVLPLLQKKSIRNVQWINVGGQTTPNLHSIDVYSARLYIQYYVTDFGSRHGEKVKRIHRDIVQTPGGSLPEAISKFKLSKHHSKVQKDLLSYISTRRMTSPKKWISRFFCLKSFFDLFKTKPEYKLTHIMATMDQYIEPKDAMESWQSVCKTHYEPIFYECDHFDLFFDIDIFESIAGDCARVIRRGNQEKAKRSIVDYFGVLSPGVSR